ncbi:MAG: hypothetical protein HQ517_12135 [SAR324 cluster bacterium]|nr:hypothetical protein [SAR324 cluster bacterium]
MRVTEVTKHNTVQSNLNKTSEVLQNTLIGVSNGKILNKPSDDPVGAAKVQDFRTSINHSKTLEKNISADKVWLNSSEETIKQITDSLMHVKELALEGSNGASTVEHRESLAGEIKLITNDLIDLGNKREGKLYIFSGTKTFTKPLESNPEIKEAAVMFHGTRIKSTEKIIPLNQDKPLPGLLPGTLTFSFEDLQKTTAETEAANATAETEATNNPAADSAENTETTEGPPIPNQITIVLEGTESLQEIVEKINQAAIAEQKYAEDLHSPHGFKAKVYAEIGRDNSLYLDPESNIKLKFGPDTTGFFQLMKFGVIGNPENYLTDAEESELPIVMDEPVAQEEFKAEFKGYSKQKYQVRITKGGSYGVAQFNVSDDGGESWSKAQLLQKQNEILNPEGKASNKVKLQFGVGDKPYFKEGLEFEFGGNEFVEYRGNDQNKQVLIDNGIKVALNITANEVFFKNPEDPDTVNIFDVLNRLSKALEDDDEMAMQKSIDEITIAVNQVLDKRSRIGSTFNELESSEERIASSVDFKSSELSQLEDMDVAKGAVDLNDAELKHRVALDSAARLIQPTLINFLK